MNPTNRALRRTWLTALLGFAACAAVTNSARAEPFFPDEIQKHLGLAYTPPCTLCHATALGGGPVTTKFGQSMKANGLGVTTTSLDTALDALAAKKVDSDGDGTPDIQQIEEGRDPSTGTAAPTAPPERYGCGAHIAPTPVSFANIFLCAAASLGFAMGRRRSQFAAGGSPKERTNKS